MAAGPVDIVMSITVVKERGKLKTALVKNAIRRISLKSSWEDVLDSVVDNISEDDLPDKTLDKFMKLVKVDVAATPNGEQYTPDNDEPVQVLYEFDKTLKYVTMTFNLDLLPGQEEHEDTNNNVKKNAFAVLMTAQTLNTKPPKIIDTEKPRFNAKDRLYNDVAEDLKNDKCLFPSSYPDEVIRRHVMTIVDTLWYIDGAKLKIAQRSHSVEPLPKRFVEKFNGYNDFKAKRKAAPRLNSVDLKKHSGLLFRLVSTSFTSNWGDMKNDLEQLAISLNSYAEFLEGENTMQKYRQSLTHPVRQITENVTVDWFRSCEGTEAVDPKYAVLDRALAETNEYEPVY